MSQTEQNEIIQKKIGKKISSHYNKLDYTNSYHLFMNDFFPFVMREYEVFEVNKIIKHFLTRRRIAMHFPHLEWFYNDNDKFIMISDLLFIYFIIIYKIMERIDNSIQITDYIPPRIYTCIGHKSNPLEILFRKEIANGKISVIKRSRYIYAHMTSTEYANYICRVYNIELMCDNIMGNVKVNNRECVSNSVTKFILNNGISRYVIR
jgi:hypothetical protein